MTNEQITELSRLRDNGLTPKQIAKALGLRPTAVSELIRQQALALENGRRERGELDPIYECLIDATAARLLLGDNLEGKALGGGLATVFVTRQVRGKLVMNTFLVDYWCLGIKDADGPRRVDQHEYEQRVASGYSHDSGGHRRITLEQAQAVIFGALDYATRLGLSPHPDAHAAMETLGKRPEVMQHLEFGKDGKPFFINGPHDNIKAILQKLEKSVGKDNFGVTILMGDPGF